MPREDELEEAKLKALVDRVMDAYGGHCQKDIG